MTIETTDILDRLRLLGSGRTYPATPEMQFHGVIEDAIAEIKRLRATPMSNPETTLRACPNCGMPPRTKSLPRQGPVIPYTVWVECPSCGTRTASEVSYGAKAGAIKRAHAAWNETSSAPTAATTADAHLPAGAAVPRSAPTVRRR
jgi:hypothetical protein